MRRKGKRFQEGSLWTGRFADPSLSLALKKASMEESKWQGYLFYGGAWSYGGHRLNRVYSLLCIINFMNYGPSTLSR